MITKEFRNALQELLNRHNVENEADTPDFILADMICGLIEALGPCVKKTLDWHGCDSICHPKRPALRKQSLGRYTDGNPTGRRLWSPWGWEDTPT